MLKQPETVSILLWQDSYLVHVAWFSLKQATLSTVLSLALAIPMARALFHRQFPGRTLLLHLFGLSQVLPVIIALFGLVAVHGTQGWLQQLGLQAGIKLPDYLFGLSGILLAHVFFNMPLATRWLVQSLEQIPQNHWRQAAQLDIPEWQRFRLLEWPAIRRLLPGLASLIFMLCFTSFTIVMALGGGPQATTLEVAIYQALRFDFDLAAAGQLACWQLLLGTLIVISYGWFKPVAATLTTTSQPYPHYQKNTFLPDLLSLLPGLFLFLPPLSAIFWFGLQAVLNHAWQQELLLATTWQSLQIAIAAGSLALSLSTGLLLSSRHMTIRLRAPRSGKLLTGVGSLILLIPTSVLSTGLFILLQEGIGDTIRVSLSAPPAEEVKVGCKLLEYMGLRPRKFDIISCPSCGRSQVDVIQLATAVTEGLKDVTAPIRVAVMGCIVNGPGEAREADLGVASGNGKGQIFIKGKVIKTVPEDQIVDTLLTIANDIAAQMEADGQVPVNSTGPVVVPIQHPGH